MSLVLCSVGAAGCQTYSAELQRGQGYYEQYQYELALSLWRHLEAESGSLDEREQVRYFYLRGMTDYRLEYRDHARFWLSLAEQRGTSLPGALHAAEKQRMVHALEDLARKAPATLGVSADRASAGAAAEAGEPDQASGATCKWSSDCQAGFTCWQGRCAAVE